MVVILLGFRFCIEYVSMIVFFVWILSESGDMVIMGRGIMVREMFIEMLILSCGRFVIIIVDFRNEYNILIYYMY